MDSVNAPFNQIKFFTEIDRNTKIHMAAQKAHNSQIHLEQKVHHKVITIPAFKCSFRAKLTKYMLPHAIE
jgi:hypothetical protein